jgi:hypothetical protein
MNHLHCQTHIDSEIRNLRYELSHTIAQAEKELAALAKDIAKVRTQADIGFMDAADDREAIRARIIRLELPA